MLKLEKKTDVRLLKKQKQTFKHFFLSAKPVDTNL